MTRHSPCVGICKLDATSGFCFGCGRSGSEVASWISMSEGERDDVWRKLPERLAVLSVGVRLLPWTRDEICAWVEDTVSGGLGTWVTGAPGPAAEFPCSGAGAVDLSVSDDDIVARASDASFRLRLNDKVRAFAFRSGGQVVLGLPQARATITSSSSMQELGPDADAIDDAHRRERLFDLGVGRKSSRFCLRTRDNALATALSNHAGRPWQEVMRAIGPQIIAASPTRVVETAVARIEVFAPILSPGGSLPSGAHTHFLPGLLKAGEEIAAKLTLPDFALPVAIFYPRDDCPQEVGCAGAEIADRAGAS